MSVRFELQVNIQLGKYFSNVFIEILLTSG